MEFSAEQKANAQRDVELLFGRLCPGPMPGAAEVGRVYRGIAIRDRCQLNAAVELLRQVGALLPEKDTVIELAPDCGLGIRRYPLNRGITDAQIVNIHDFLSAFPEGGSK